VEENHNTRQALMLFILVQKIQGTVRVQNHCVRVFCIKRYSFPPRISKYHLLHVSKNSFLSTDICRSVSSIFFILILDNEFFSLVGTEYRNLKGLTNDLEHQLSLKSAVYFLYKMASTGGQVK